MSAPPPPAPRRFASRTDALTPFLAMEILERAVLLERSGIDIAHLAVGEPEFAPPAAAAEPGAAVALFSTPSPALVVVARHADTGVDAGATLKALVAQFGGKGGGKPDLAQGGGLQGTPDALVTAARELLSL